MNLSKKIKKTSLILLLTLMFTSLAKANSIAIDDNSIHKEEYTNIMSDIELQTFAILMDNEEFKDGKWKERLKELLEEFLDGFIKGVGGIADPGNGGSGGLSNEQLQYLENYAINQVQNKDNALEIFYKMQVLIESDSDTITEDQVLSAFNGQAQVLDVLKEGFEGADSIFPLDKGDDGEPQAKRGFLDKLVYAIGYIVGTLVKNKLP